MAVTPFLLNLIIKMIILFFIIVKMDQQVDDTIINILLALDNVNDLHQLCTSNKNIMGICISHDFWIQWFNKYNLKVDYNTSYNGYITSFINKYTTYLDHYQKNYGTLIYEGVVTNKYPKYEPFNIYLNKYTQNTTIKFTIFNNNIKFYSQDGIFLYNIDNINDTDIYQFIHDMVSYGYHFTFNAVVINFIVERLMLLYNYLLDSEKDINAVYPYNLLLRNESALLYRANKQILNEIFQQDTDMLDKPSNQELVKKHLNLIINYLKRNNFEKIPGVNN